jgi:phage terminase large subunit-like protein
MDQRKLAAAIKRLDKLEKSESFDPAMPGSKPTNQQQAVFKDIETIQHRYVIAGNQCKPGYSKVLMADGSLKNISKIEPGEKVFTFDTKTEKLVPSTVLRTWQNGIKPVYRYYTGSDCYTDATDNHEMVQKDIVTGTYSKKKIGSTDTILQLDSQVIQRLITRSEYIGEMSVFDITVDHPDHNYICDGYVTGNSGKSSLAAREIAWILNDNHPFWTRPTRWGDEPLLIIVAGQDRKMMEIELWEKKLALFLNKSEWRGMRQGGTLQYVENKKTGDKVVFLSHSDSSEKNRKHMQGYVAHFVWLDEMPSKVGILEELQRRVDARRGYLLATFTPKFRNDEIRRIIEAAEPPLAKKYRLSKLDNPLYRDRLDEELQKLNGYNESMKAAILYGDWMVGEGMVYDWNPEFMEQEPEAYSYAWRHVVAVDPALKSKCGFTLWAEEPRTGIWYLVKDDYITNILDPESLALEIENRIKGYNVIRRITDTMAWFVGAASKLGITYMQPYDKNSRKDQLIKALQSDLSQGKIKIAPWCTMFKDEIQSCQWSDTSDRIINSSSYHTLDSCQYFVDCKPKYDNFVPGATWHEELRRGNQKRKEQEKMAKKVSKGGRVKPLAAWGTRRRTARIGR